MKRLVAPDCGAYCPPPQPIPLRRLFAEAALNAAALVLTAAAFGAVWVTTIVFYVAVGGR
jgi:hypothetical protein